METAMIKSIEGRRGIPAGWPLPVHQGYMQRPTVVKTLKLSPRPVIAPREAPGLPMPVRTNPPAPSSSASPAMSVLNLRVPWGVSVEILRDCGALDAQGVRWEAPAGP